MDGEASAEKSTSRVASTWKSVREGWPLALTVRATLHYRKARVGLAIRNLGKRDAAGDYRLAEHIAGHHLCDDILMACIAPLRTAVTLSVLQDMLDLSLWCICKICSDQCSGAALDGRVEADGALLRPRVGRRPAQSNCQVALAHALHISS